MTKDSKGLWIVDQQFTPYGSELEQPVSNTAYAVSRFSGNRAGSEYENVEPSHIPITGKTTITYQSTPDSIVILSGKRYFFTDSSQSKYHLDPTGFAKTDQVKLYIGANEEGTFVEIDPSKIAISADKKKLTIETPESAKGQVCTLVITPKGSVKAVVLHDTKDNGDKDFATNVYAQTLSDLVDDRDNRHKFVTAAEKAQITTNNNRITTLESYFNQESTVEATTLAAHVSAANVNEVLEGQNTRRFVTVGEKAQITTNANNIAELQKNFDYEAVNGEIWLSYGRTNASNTVRVKADQIEEHTGRRFVTDTQIEEWTNKKLDRLSRRTGYSSDGVKYAYTAVDATEGQTAISATGLAGTLVERDVHGQVVAAPFNDYIPATADEISNNAILKYKKVSRYDECTVHDLETLNANQIYVVDEEEYVLATAEAIADENIVKYKKIYTGEYEQLSQANAEAASASDVFVAANPNAAVTSGYVNHRLDELTTDIEAQLATKENLANKSQTIYLENAEGYDTANLAADIETKYPSVKAVRQALDDVREVAYGKTNTFVVDVQEAVPAVYDENDPETIVTPAVDAKNIDLNTQADSITITSLEVDGNANAIKDLKVGDVIYVLDTELPDRWVSAVSVNYTQVTTPVTAATAIGLYKREGAEEPYTYVKVESLADYVKGQTYYKEESASATLRIMETAKVNIARIDMTGRGELVPVNQVVTIPTAEPYDSLADHQYTGVVSTGNPASTHLATNSSGVISVVTATDNEILVTGERASINNVSAAPDHAVITVSNMDAAVAASLLNNDYIAGNSVLQTEPAGGTNWANRFKDWMHIQETDVGTVSGANVTPDGNEYISSITTHTGSGASVTKNIMPVSVETYTGTTIARTLTLGTQAYQIPRGRLDYEELADYEY